MNENTNLTGWNVTPENGEKTFTQEQLNAIVSKRLAEEKAKSEAVTAQREQEFARRELLLSAKEKLTAKGLPLELLDALNMSNAEDLDKSLAIIEKLKPTQPLKLTGIAPGEARQRPKGNDTLVEIRKAMGLK